MLSRAIERKNLGLPLSFYGIGRSEKLLAFGPKNIHICGGYSLLGDGNWSSLRVKVSRVASGNPILGYIVFDSLGVDLLVSMVVEDVEFKSMIAVKWVDWVGCVGCASIPEGSGLDFDFSGGGLPLVGFDGVIQNCAKADSVVPFKGVGVGGGSSIDVPVAIGGFETEVFPGGGWRAARDEVMLVGEVIGGPSVVWILALVWIWLDWVFMTQLVIFFVSGATCFNAPRLEPFIIAS